MSRLSVTYKLVFKVNANITSAAKLELNMTFLDFGKWEISPPDEIGVDKAGSFKEITFKASSREGSIPGPKGFLEYKGTDIHHTVFKFSFEIPHHGDNWGTLTGGSDNYTITGGTVPASGSNVNVDVIITQIKPIA